MSKKKDAKENLAIENYKKLNDDFYKNYNENYFECKLYNILLILSDSEEYFKKNMNLELKFGKITLKNSCETVEEKKEFINYAKSELISTYYHCLETFIRLFISHSKLDYCPWIDIVSLSINKYRKKLDDIIEEKYSFIKSGETIDNVLQSILTGSIPKEQKKYLENVKTWIHYAAIELKNISSYNSLKHGLVNFNSHDGIKIIPDNNNVDKIFEKLGDSLKILKTVEKKNRYVYELETKFIDYDFLSLKIHIFSEMINNIIKIGKHNYMKEEVETVGTLIAGRYSYNEILNEVLENDEKNLGQLLSNYSIELLYYKDTNR